MARRDNNDRLRRDRERRRRQQQRRRAEGEYVYPELYARIMTGEEVKEPHNAFLFDALDRRPALMARYRNGLHDGKLTWIYFSTLPCCPCPSCWPAQREAAAELWRMIHVRRPDTVVVSDAWHGMPLPSFTDSDDFRPLGEVAADRQEDDFDGYHTDDGEKLEG